MDIAVIGMGCVFPGANTVEQFWQNLVNQCDSIGTAPTHRWLEQQAHQFPNYAGFIEGVDEFDATFFGIPENEAQLMDPQQRILMQCVWHSLEDAGLCLDEVSGKKINFHLGISNFDYAKRIAHETKHTAMHPSSLAHSIAANRISYWFNFSGASEAIDTACSSSLVAVHHAVSALQQGECELAIAAGVNAILSPDLFDSFYRAGMLSPDGRCKTFDKSADGYVRGEGVGVVVLKPYAKAQADHDKIYALIKSSSVNHGGHVSGLTVPNPKAQAALISDALEKALIPPQSLSYIECHGTGTSLGDPIEVDGLKSVFKQRMGREYATASKFCGLGSVKTNSK